MAKDKGIIGESVDYYLSAEDARKANELRPKAKRRLEAGERGRLKIEIDHGGDCASGEVKIDGSEFQVERRNRGFGQGNWDWVRPAA